MDLASIQLAVEILAGVSMLVGAVISFFVARRRAREQREAAALLKKQEEIDELAARVRAAEAAVREAEDNRIDDHLSSLGRLVDEHFQATMRRLDHAEKKSSDLAGLVQEALPGLRVSLLTLEQKVAALEKAQQRLGGSLEHRVAALEGARR